MLRTLPCQRRSQPFKSHIRTPTLTRTPTPNRVLLVRISARRQQLQKICRPIVSLVQPEEQQENKPLFDPLICVPPTMKGYGSFQGATLQRSKLDQRQKIKQQAPKTDDSGGGGDIGKKIFNGGGGDGDDGDDDDYFAGGDEGDEGDQGGFWRSGMLELYDKVSIGAVLSEWYRTMSDMPLILRRAVEMGLYSSAQLVRFVSMDCRHNVQRVISRKLPLSQSRAFVGRLMADPAFFKKLLFEMGLAGTSSLVYEWNCRRSRFTKELDFALANTLGVAFATGAAVWLLAPSRSYGAVHKFPWQNMLSSLPNNVFDRAGPLQTYTMPSRAASFFMKVAELSSAGALAGFLTASLSNLALTVRKMKDPEYRPSMPVPQIWFSAAGLGTFTGLNLNLRYQALNGMDRFMFDKCNYLWFYLIATGLVRFSANRLEEGNRRWCQGLPVAVRRPVSPQQKRVRKVKKVRKVNRSVPQSVPESQQVQFQTSPSKVVS